MATRCGHRAPLVFLFLLSAASLAAAAAVAAAGGGGILTEACAKTPHPDVCTAVLSASPDSRTADVRRLAEIAIGAAARIGAAAGAFSRAELDVVKDTELWQCLDECAEDIEDAVANLDDSEGDGIDDDDLKEIRLFVGAAERDAWSCEESCKHAPPDPVKDAVLAKNNEFENIMRVTSSLIDQAFGVAAPAPAPSSP